MFAGNFAPAGWLFCAGQLLPISENEILFQLIGTTYGGDGETTFALPDLRGRVPIHQGTGSGLSSRILGENGGVESVTLTTQQIPAHSHAWLCSTAAAGSKTPQGNVPAVAQGDAYATSLDNAVAMAPQSVAPAGGSQPHTNFQPYLCVNFIISLFGLYPRPN
jgi:microcystin-dependent protein